jgi:hypothetical protein
MRKKLSIAMTFDFLRIWPLRIQRRSPARVEGKQTETARIITGLADKD